MERQKELPKIKICLFKATTVASGGGEETLRQTFSQTDRLLFYAKSCNETETETETESETVKQMQK